MQSFQRLRFRKPLSKKARIFLRAPFERAFLINAIFSLCTDPEKLPPEALEVPFSEIIWPWVSQALHPFVQNPLLTPQAIVSLKLSFLKRLSHLMTPTLHFEMKLEAATSLFHSEDRTASQQFYADFLRRRFFDPKALGQFFEEYPSLKEQIEICSELFIEHVEEFLDRLKKDLFRLEKTFQKGKPLGPIEELQMDLGDLHNRGRSVLMASFSSGKKILYKPKSLEMTRLFHLFLKRLNQLGLSPPLFPYTILSRKGYGWEEALVGKPCSSMNEVKRYFIRSGSYLCLAFLLRGTDLHYENLIAFKEHPFLIDLETLFYPPLPLSVKDLAKEILSDSSLATGLVPLLFFDGKKVSDFSGLGQKDPLLHLKWIDLSSHLMREVLEEKKGGQSPNQVIYQDTLCLAHEFIDEILKGFSDTYLFIQKNKQILLKEKWIEKMGKLPVRILLRPTRFYADLKNRLFSPHALLQPQIKEEALSLLKRPFWNLEEIKPSLIEEETRSLLIGDIPHFYTSKNAPHLFSNQTLIEKNYFDSTGLEKVMSRLSNMSRKELTMQKGFIKQSFLAQSFSAHNIGKSAPKKRKQGPLSFLSGAIAIAKDLKKRAIYGKDGSLNWIGVQPQLDVDRSQLGLIGESLYSGNAGIALFFAALCRVSQDLQWKKLALQTLFPLQTILKEQKERAFISAFGIGGMAGVGGILYSLTQMAHLLKEEKLLQEAKKWVDAIDEEMIESDDKLDIVFGSAGLLLSLLCFHKAASDPKALFLAQKAADHLMKSCHKISLLGFSHGTAGAAYALSQLNHPKYNAAIQTLLSFERGAYCPEQKNWPRLSEKGPSTFPVSWCHGAAGIGLSRVAILPNHKDLPMKEEISIAIQACKHCLLEGPLSLCCGPLGRLEFLWEAQKQFLPMKELVAPMIEECTSYLFEQMRNSQPFLIPGLMQGAAGFGLTLLRCMDQTLPRILLLS